MKSRNLRILFYLSFLFLTFYSTLIYSQVPIITVSHEDGTIDKSVPFDQPFILRIPYKSNKINSIRFTEILPKKDVITTIAQKTYDFSRKGRKFTLKQIPQENLSYHTVGKIKYVYAHFEYPFLFKSGKKYAIIAGTRTSINYLDFLSDFYSKSQMATSENRNLDQKEITDLQAEYKKITKPRTTHISIQSPENDEKVPEKVTVRFGHFPAYSIADTLFQKRLIEYIDSFLISSFTEIEISKNKIKNRTNEALDSLAKIPEVINYPDLRTGTIDYFSGINYFQDSTYYKDAISWLSINNSNEMLEKVLTGTNELFKLKSKPKVSFLDRIQILEKNISYLSDLYAQANFLNQNYKGYPSLVKRLKIMLYVSSGNLASYYKVQNEYENLFKKISTSTFNYELIGSEGNIKVAQHFENVAFYSTNSFIGSIEARNRFSIVPDISFGRLNTFGIGNFPQEKLAYNYIPNLGFSISFLPINRDIRFNSYDKSFFQRFTVDIGWSLVSMRIEDEVENFFENSTLYTGVGYRLSNVIRLQAGTQWVNLINDDRLNDSQVPFIGISVDLSVKTFVNGLTDQITGFRSSKVEATSVE